MFQCELNISLICQISIAMYTYYGSIRAVATSVVYVEEILINKSIDK